MSLKSLLESCLPQSTNIGKIVRNLKARNITYDQILNSNESDLQQTLCDGGVQRKYRRKIIARVKKLQSTNGSSPVSSTNIKKNFKLKINVCVMLVRDPFILHHFVYLYIWFVFT